MYSILREWGEVEWRRPTVSWGAWLIIADEWQACLTLGCRCALNSRITHDTRGHIWNLLFSLWYLLSYMSQSRHAWGFYECLVLILPTRLLKMNQNLSSAQPGNIQLSWKYLSSTRITEIPVKQGISVTLTRTHHQSNSAVFLSLFLYFCPRVCSSLKMGLSLM